MSLDQPSFESEGASNITGAVNEEALKLIKEKQALEAQMETFGGHPSDRARLSELESRLQAIRDGETSGVPEMSEVSETHNEVSLSERLARLKKAA